LELHSEILTGQPTRMPNGYEYKIFQSPFTFEKSAKFYTYTFVEIIPNPDKSNFLNGRFEFDNTQNSTIQVSGFVFDLNNAAADVCESWAAKEKMSFDFSADSQSYKESQKFQQLYSMAQSFRAKATLFGVGTASYNSGDWNANNTRY
jgi:hypothetical protein